MNYLFLGSFYFSEEEDKLEELSKCGLQNSIVNFQNNMLSGLREFMQPDDTLYIINHFPLGTYPKQARCFFLNGEKRRNYQRLSLVNIHVVKQIWYNHQAKVLIREWVKSLKGEEGKIIMYDLLRPYLKSLSSLNAANIKKYTIIADLPNEFGYNKNEHGLKALVKKHLGYQNMKMVSKLDCFGLLTKQMAGPLHLENRNCLVIEGFSNENRFYRPLEIDSYVILYTGLISVEYNIDGLLSAFSMLKEKHFQLWICGPGPSIDLVKEYSERDSRIKYKGCLPQSKIAELQSHASILINPRLNVGEFTKYSFPSKIIEYMSTARPVIAYRLSGIPEDYYKYLIAPDDNSPECLSQLMKKVLDYPTDKKRLIGLSGRQFVIERTNPKKQMQKLLNLID